MTGNDMAMRAQGGNPRDVDALVRFFNGLAEATTHKVMRYTPPGYEWEDFYQVARLGVHQAMTQWDRSGSFDGWAAYVAARRVKDELSKATRQKHEPLAEAATGAFETLNLRDSYAARDSVHDLACLREQIDAIGEAVSAYSEPERVGLLGTSQDVPYGELAAKVGVNVKAIDNATQRARRKLRQEVAA